MEKLKPPNKKEKPHGGRPSRREFLRRSAAIGIGVAIESVIPKSLFAQEPEEHERAWLSIEKSVEKLKTRFNLQPNEFAIIIDPSKHR